MNKLLLILKREYLIRVKKKMFIVTTLLTPLGIGLLGLISGYLASTGGNTSQIVMMKDDANILKDRIKSNETMTFNFSQNHIDSLKNTYEGDGANILVHFKAEDMDNPKPLYFSNEKLGIATLERIESRIGEAVKDYKIDQSGIDRGVYDNLKTKISLENGAKDTSDKGDTSSKLSIVVGTILGGFMAFMMYFVIFIYGGLVMRSVMEEKVNRIVEVMISSVKPFQLMMGKILGVGLVGLTQLGIWMLLIPLVLMAVQFVFGGPADANFADMTETMNGVPQEAIDDFNVQQIIMEFMNLNWGFILPVFIIFFFGGYFIYSAMFAAIGSATGDDLGESQQLMIPVTIPIILALFIAQAAIQDPNSTLSVFGSMFPLFSPIIMPVRLAFDPPLWQVALSILILIGSCIFFAWLAGRIYRTGILLYGKKVSFKELAKWMFYKG